MAHTLNHRHHFTLCQPQPVSQIVHSRLCLCLPDLGCVFLRNQRPDNPDGCFHLFLVKEHRLCDPATRLIHIPRHDSCGIDLRHVVAPLQVASLLQCRQRCAHTGLYINFSIVPPGLTGYLERRATHTVASFGEESHSPPYLIDLTDTQLGLVEENKMLVEVPVAIEHKAFSLQLRVAAGTACLLHIVFERVGNVVMHYKPHVFLVDAHPERRGGDDDAHTVAHESILIGSFLVRLHLSIERQCLITVARQFVGKFPRTSRPRHVDDYRTVIFRDESPKPLIFHLIGIGIDDRVAEIGAGGARGEELELTPQGLHEIIADILHHFLLGRCRETRYRDGMPEALPPLIITDELADIKIIHPEILSPRRETVSLIDDKPHHLANRQDALDGVRPQHLRGDIQE